MRSYGQLSTNGMPAYCTGTVSTSHVSIDGQHYGNRQISWWSEMYYFLLITLSVTLYTLLALPRLRRHRRGACPDKRQPPVSQCSLQVTCGRGRRTDPTSQQRADRRVTNLEYEEDWSLDHSVVSAQIKSGRRRTIVVWVSVRLGERPRPEGLHAWSMLEQCFGRPRI